MIAGDVFPAVSRVRRAFAASALLAVCAIAGACAATSPLTDPVVRADGLESFGPADYAWPLRTLDGDTTSLHAFRGRPLFINMWATWCAPCVAELGSIAALRDSLAGAPVEFLLVSPEEPARVRAFLRRHGYDLPVYLEAAPMPDGFGLRALPTTFVVGADGDIVLRHRGAARWDVPGVTAFLRHLADRS